MWELDCEEGWVPKNWCFWTVVWEKTLESPLDCKEIHPVHPKGDQSWVFIGRADAEAETPILWPPHAKSWLIGKDLDAGRDWGQEEKGKTEDEMAGWHHRLDGPEFEQTLGVGDGQGGLVCCNSWGCKESDTTERLNWLILKSMDNLLNWRQTLFHLICCFLWVVKSCLWLKCIRSSCNPSLLTCEQHEMLSLLCSYKPRGFPDGTVGKEPPCQHKRHWFNPWVGKIPWRRKWQPSPAFLLEKSHGQRSLVGCSPLCCKRVGHDLVTKTTNQWWTALSQLSFSS